MDSDHPAAEETANTARDSDGVGSSAGIAPDNGPMEQVQNASENQPPQESNDSKAPGKGSKKQRSDRGGDHSSSSSSNRKKKNSANKHRMMLGMWRRECNVQYFTGKPMEVGSFSIPARPLHVWAEFLTAGVLNAKFQKSRSANSAGPSEDPWGVDPLIRAHVSADWQEKETDRQAKVRTTYNHSWLLLLNAFCNTV